MKKLLHDEKEVPILGAEVNFIVKDSIKALNLYKKIFENSLEVIEESDFGIGSSEVIFTIHSMRFHMLDENENYNMVAPTGGHINTIWYNVSVRDIKQTHANAIKNLCKELQEVTKMDKMGISNSMFIDTFGYVWLLHEVHEVKTYEERIQALKEMGIGNTE